MRLTAHVFVTIDGVMQSPGGVEEDTTGGFDRGGWQVPLFDDAVGAIVAGWFDRTGAILIGRRTYDTMAPFWSQVTDAALPINTKPKYVVSNTLTDPAWANCRVLSGDVIEQVRGLKARPGDELQVHGSWQLLQALTAAGLVDEYRVLTFPVVVGSGKRLFAEGTPASGFDVVDSAVTPTGVVHTALVPRPFTAGTYVVSEGREAVAQSSST